MNTKGTKRPSPILFFQDERRSYKLAQIALNKKEKLVLLLHQHLLSILDDDALVAFACWCALQSEFLADTLW